VARELPLLRLTLRAAVEWRWGGGDGGGGGDMTGGGHGTDGGAPTALLALIDERWTSVLRELRRLSAEPQGEAPRSHPPNLHLTLPLLNSLPHHASGFAGSEKGEDQPQQVEQVSDGVHT